MAENQEKAGPVLVMVDPQQNAAQQLAAEQAAKRAAGIKLDEGVPGGHFLGTDGEPHDAHGRPIKAGRALGAVSPEDAAARLREIDEERAALQNQIALGTAQSEATANAAADTQGAPGATTSGSKGSAKKSGGKK